MLEQQDASVDEVESANHLTTVTTASTGGEHRRETFLQRLKPFHGTFSNQSLWKMILRPFLVLINPLVLWYILIVSFTTAWVIVISFCIAEAFAGPPYSLSIAQQGYMSIGPIVGSLLGCIACGLVCDPLARYFTSKNHGIYEPEFRLPMFTVAPIVSTIGYFLFGNLIAQGESPVGASAMFGLVYVSVQFAAVSAGAHVVDAFRDISVDIFIISMTMKNFLFFGFTCRSPVRATHLLQSANVVARFPEQLVCEMGAGQDIQYHQRYPACVIIDYYPGVYLWQETQSLVAHS